MRTRRRRPPPPWRAGGRSSRPNSSPTTSRGKTTAKMSENYQRGNLTCSPPPSPPADSSKAFQRRQFSTGSGNSVFKIGWLCVGTECVPLGNHSTAHLIKSILKSNILPYFCDAPDERLIACDKPQNWKFYVFFFLAGTHFLPLFIIICSCAHANCKKKSAVLRFIFVNSIIHVVVCLRIL